MTTAPVGKNIRTAAPSKKKIGIGKTKRPVPTSGQLSLVKSIANPYGDSYATSYPLSYEHVDRGWHQDEDADQDDDEMILVKSEPKGDQTSSDTQKVLEASPAQQRTTASLDSRPGSTGLSYTPSMAELKVRVCTKHNAELDERGERPINLEKHNFDDKSDWQVSPTFVMTPRCT